jgi:tetratricopeptide (TPR) repeat protein
MAKKKKQDPAEEQLLAVEETLSKTERYIEENQNTLFTIVAAIVLVVGGFYGWQKFIVAPNELEASEEIVWAQMRFEADSFNLALNGDMNNLGLLDIADEYGSTKTGNVANYMAGVAYMKMGNYTEAIRYLDKYDLDDKMVAPIALGAIGDCFMEINQPEDALDYYVQASEKSTNAFTTPIYLKKAGQTSEMLGNYSSAVKYYNRIKNDYPDSQEAQQIEKFIARAEMMNK